MSFSVSGSLTFHRKGSTDLAISGTVLETGREIFLIDDNYYEEHVYDTPRVGVCEKRTINGKAFEIVKVFYSEGELNGQTNQVGLSLTVDRSTHFVWGHGGKL